MRGHFDAFAEICHLSVVPRQTYNESETFDPEVLDPEVLKQF